MALTYSSMLELGTKIPHFELKNVLDDLNDLFNFENQNQAHHFLRYNKEYIYNAFGDNSILTWNFFSK